MGLLCPVQSVGSPPNNADQGEVTYRTESSLVATDRILSGRAVANRIGDRGLDPRVSCPAQSECAIHFRVCRAVTGSNPCPMRVKNVLYQLRH
jgi:hypothetical protein